MDCLVCGGAGSKGPRPLRRTFEVSTKAQALHPAAGPVLSVWPGTLGEASGIARVRPTRGLRRLAGSLTASPQRPRRPGERPTARLHVGSLELLPRWPPAGAWASPTIPSASRQTVRLENCCILVCFVHVQSEASVLRGASELSVAPAHCCRPPAWACNAARPSCLGGQMLPRFSRHCAL